MGGSFHFVGFKSVFYFLLVIPFFPPKGKQILPGFYSFYPIGLPPDSKKQGKKCALWQQNGKAIRSMV